MIITTLGVFLFFIVAYTASPVFKARMDYTLDDMGKMVFEDDYRGSLSARFAMWKIGSENFLHSPLIGTGIGDEAQYSQEDIKSYDLEYFMSTNGTFYYVDYHNAFVQYLVQLGIIGFVLFLSLFYFILKIKIRYWIYHHLKILFFILFVLWSMIGLTLHLNTSMIFFVLFTAVFMKISYYEKKESGNQLNAL
jgi:O-antigen ligase